MSAENSGHEFNGRCILLVSSLWMLGGALISICSNDGGAKYVAGLNDLNSSDMKDFIVAILTIFGLTRLLTGLLVMLAVFISVKPQIYRLSLIFWLVATIYFLLKMGNFRHIDLSRLNDTGKQFFFAFDAEVLFAFSTAAGICMWFEEKFKVERTLTGTMVRAFGWEGGPSSRASTSHIGGPGARL
jgi:hypothetical protein